MKSNKSLPLHIINLINLRRSINTNIRKASFEEKKALTPKYNELTKLLSGKNFDLDKDKANLFASFLGKTFTSDSFTSDFCLEFYYKVEESVSAYDYGQPGFNLVNTLEIKSIIKKLKVSSSPGEDGIHFFFLKHLSASGLNLLLKSTYQLIFSKGITRLLEVV